MKRTFVFVALLTLCGKPTQTQSSRESRKLGDSYAKAALLSLLAIESDLSTTEDRNGQKLVTGTTQSKIDSADAEARTTQEQSMTKLLRQVYQQKLFDNALRKAEHDILDVLIKGYPDALEYYKRFPNTQLSTPKDEMGKRAAEVDRIDAKMSKREAACFEPLKQALRDRVSITPEPCIRFISNEDAKPEKQPKH